MFTVGPEAEAVTGEVMTLCALAAIVAGVSPGPYLTGNCVPFTVTYSVPLS